MVPRRLSLQALAALCLLPLQLPQAQAQAFPSRPIRLVVALAPGGSVDAVARVLASELAGRLSQPVVVDNRLGAGGNIGADFVAKSAPDGYTLLMGAANLAINAGIYKNSPFNAATDFTPIALVGTVPSLMLVSPQLPARDLKEFLALAKAKPGGLSYASGGVGTSEHLAGKMLESATGIKLLHIPYKGGGPAINDLLGGQVAAMFPNQVTAQPYIKSGQLRAIGIMAAHRAPALPDIPTFAELGIPNFRVAAWWGVMGPAGMPAEVVQTLNRAINAALDSATMKDRLAKMSAEPLGGSAQQFVDFYKSEIATWGAVVRESGATAE